MRIAVLIKQVPRFDAMQLRADGRLERDGLELELNPYCRRAVSKGVELARGSEGGTCTVVTMGPPSAEDALREAIACGATDGLLLSDEPFAGSDTLATARALAGVLAMGGPFDLILTGRNSVDADTGQIGPEVAEILGLPFVGGVRTLTIDDSGAVRARCEYDDGWVDIETCLPAVLSCAERLCDPAKADPARRAAVEAGSIRRLTAADLGHGPWGQDASPTRVGEVRLVEAVRQGLVLTGTVAEQVRRAVALLADAGALRPDAEPSHDLSGQVPQAAPSATGPIVAVLLEPGRRRVGRELLGAAAGLAVEAGGSVTALGAPETAAPWQQWGADTFIELTGSTVEDDVAAAVGLWAATTKPGVLLAPATMWGRHVAARVAARLGAGLTGDAVDLTMTSGRLVGWKPAFGGRLVAAITSSSETQMVTVRPGMLPVRTPRAPGSLAGDALAVAPGGRVRHLGHQCDADTDRLLAAGVVIGLGTGVAPEEYPTLEPLRVALGAELAATRKITDRGWLPRSLQVGITGHSIGPRLYVAIGLSGKFNHMVGVRGAGQILAINRQPDAPVFATADIGIVADWREAVPLLVAELSKPTATANVGPRRQG